MNITPESLFQTLSSVKLGGSTCLYTREQCDVLAPQINQINALKKEKNTVILSHSYVSPEIIYGVSDFVGDSYELSKYAQSVECDQIIFVAVRFMAETAKLLNPSKRVFIPGSDTGCSLADSITAEDVLALRQKYPEHTFVCYINTSAAVKALCDVCVTSSNVNRIIEAIPNSKIYFLPDRLMAQNVINDFQKKGIEKEILYSSGTCYVHEKYDPEMIQYIRSQYPGVSILSHPECGSGVLAESDFVGSTSQMIQHVKTTDAPHFFMLTECGLTSRIQTEIPSKHFVGTCSMCKYMKSNHLSDIYRVLTHPKPEEEIDIPESVQGPALACIQAMFSY